MAETVQLQCACGEVKGQLKVVPGHFFHVHCLCCDCQQFANELGNADKILDKHGGSELFQTYPAYMDITQGKGNIACMQLHPKGLYRWYTSCCNMPLANTMTSGSVPFVGISVKLMQFADEQTRQDTLGPVTVKAFGKYAIGEMPQDAHERFPLSSMPKIIAFMVKGKFNKRHQPNPFFIDGVPVASAVTGLKG
ncbi:DUF6151 family protein [Shewanella corallii]|uniref:DUF6151 family protein n=1 Tax=Shewanella corallii TaxID=560080 RepID=A0ABT0NBE8_9GAMM|nr:DUF6151 family protein [Shewanella corallii]MCL2915705.1 DUF6151 family protein [Shewanella corallii]